MQEIQLKLKLCTLLEPFAFKSLSLAKNLENFFFLSDNHDFSFLKKPSHQQKLYINSALKILTKSLTETYEHIWAQLLFVDTLVLTCQSSLLTKEFIEFLTDICSDLNSSLNKVKTLKPAKDKFFSSKISSGISKLKSIISLPQTFSHSNLTPKNFSHHVFTSRAINVQQVLTSILDSVLSYERKKLQIYDFILTIKFRFQKSQPIVSEKQTFQTLVESTWKVINLIKIHSAVVKEYKKIVYISQQINPFILATFMRFCKDSMILYPYVVVAINMGANSIKQKYDAIVSQKLPKQIRKAKLQNLSRDMAFVEVDNLIQELTQINETIFYLFCAKAHFKYLTFQIPKKFFLNTTHQKLDDIHMIIKEVHQASQKHQKSKMYISQMAQKLDESVSKVVEKEKEKKKQSMTNLGMRQKYGIENNPTNEQNGLMGNPKQKGLKKKPSFFEEFTQEV